MKIATNNKLAHYQVELQELNEQTMMLQSQLGSLSNQITQLQGYLNANGGDRQALSRYKELGRQFRTMQTQVRRNQLRMQRLVSMINQENARLCRSMTSGRSVRYNNY